MREIATIPPATPVMAAPGGKSVVLGEYVGVTDTLGGLRAKARTLLRKVY